MAIIDNFINLAEIETERLILRKCNVKNIKQFYKIASNPNVTTWIPWEYHKSIEETTMFVNSLVEGYIKGTCTTWGIYNKKSNMFMGLTSFVHIKEKNFNAEIGYWIGEEYWNQGYTTEAVRAVIRYGFEVLGLHRITAGHFVDNPASGKVMEKAGMVFEGKLKDEAYHRGKFYDINIYAIINE